MNKILQVEITEKVAKSVHKHLFCKNISNTKKCAEKIARVLFVYEGLGKGTCHHIAPATSR